MSVVKDKEGVNSNADNGKKVTLWLPSSLTLLFFDPPPPFKNDKISTFTAVASNRFIFGVANIITTMICCWP